MCVCVLKEERESPSRGPFVVSLGIGYCTLLLSKIGRKFVVYDFALVFLCLVAIDGLFFRDAHLSVSDRDGLL